MSPDLKVVRIDRAPLTDTAACLRQMADAIDDGEYGVVPSLFVVMPRDDEFPLLFGWGDVEGNNQPIVQLELAKAWLINNLVAR